MQQLSAITRKRLAAKAVERLEDCTRTLLALQQTVDGLQQQSRNEAELIKAEASKVDELQQALHKSNKDKALLLDRVSALEKDVTDYDIRNHDLRRKVGCHICAPD